MDKELKSQLQQFQKYLNKEPNKADVRVNDKANNTLYLPISFLEMKMDELFFGLWGLSDFRHSVIGNELVGSIVLWYIHPITGQRIERVGAAATMIRCKQGQPFDANGKIANALEMDMPHLKADCIRNACATLGKIFGRDLNRKHKAEFKGVLPESVGTEQHAQKALSSEAQKISEELKGISSIDEMNTYYNSLKMAGVTVTKEIHGLFSQKVNEINDK